MNGLASRYWQSLSPALRRYYRASLWPSTAFIALTVLHEWVARQPGLASGWRKPSYRSPRISAAMQ